MTDPALPIVLPSYREGANLRLLLPQARHARRGATNAHDDSVRTGIAAARHGGLGWTT